MSTDQAASAVTQDIVRARAGDRAALDRLLSRLQGQFEAGARRFVSGNLKAKTRASDLLQDAYVQVVRRIDEFQGSTEGEFAAWVAAIIDSCGRREYRYLTATKRKAPTGTTELTALARAYLGATTSPVSELHHAERVSLVHEAVRSLRDDYRVVIQEIVLGGRPVPDVARDLGRTEQATRMLLCRARAALTVRLDALRRPTG
ncbi:MAG: sigma-70 family RNA polymerase sigma factor [Planctomycetota bacterium]